MTQQLKTDILAVLQRAPEWLRQDFGSKDATARERAEETLAAMVSDTIVTDGARQAMNQTKGRTYSGSL